ncbi:hypothetical protein KSF73_16120 [Burkholderiaceae bacterium DAT-1]|nr:hypothetical protein [Burkholderiaceae bacterium DAT-1]
MKYFAAIQQAKASQAREEAYRLLALDIGQTQQQVVDGLSKTQAAVETLNARLAEIERILKQVE